MAACYNYSCVLPIHCPPCSSSRSYTAVITSTAVIEAGRLMYGNTLGNVTGFARNKQAFNGANGFLAQLCVSGTNFNAIATDGNNKAASILLYHIVSSPYVASELLDMVDTHMLLQTKPSGYHLTVSTSSGSKFISSYDPTVDLSLELSTLYNRSEDFTSSRFNDIFQASLSLEVSNSYVHPVAQSVHVGFTVGGGQIEIIGRASSGTVVQSNVKVCNSVVVHIINAVLLPSSPLSTIPSQPSHNEPERLDPAISSTLLLGLVATAATSVLLL